MSNCLFENRLFCLLREISVVQYVGTTFQLHFLVDQTLEDSQSTMSEECLTLWTTITFVFTINYIHVVHYQIFTDLYDELLVLLTRLTTTTWRACTEDTFLAGKRLSD